MKNQVVMRNGWGILRALLPVQLARRNAFFFPFIPSHLSVVGLAVTHNCNSRCRTCPIWKYKASNELSLDEIGGVLTQLRELGSSFIILTCGEPLLRKDLVGIVRRATGLKFEEILLLTNGLLLTENLAQQVIEAGVTRIWISVDGREEINDSIRGVKGYFKNAISVLEVLSALRQNKYPYLDVGVVQTIMKETVGEIIPVANLAKELGVKLFFSPLLDTAHLPLDSKAVPDSVTSPSAAGAVDIRDLWVEDQYELDKVMDELHEMKSESPNLFPVTTTHVSLEYVRRYFRDPRRGDIPCMLGHTSLTISSHGEVYPGCWVFGPVGNIREKSLREIITSEEYNKKRRKIFYKKCSGCSCNYELNLLYWIPWIKDGIKWRIKLRTKGKY